jgi:glutamate/tyrosine decarboxylase-like PLP-dependent enzyme
VIPFSNFKKEIMHALLKSDKENIGSIFDKVANIAEEFYSQQSPLPASRHIENIRFKNLPQKGMGADAALDVFQKNYAPFLNNSAGARYFGFVTGGSTPASVAGDWLVSAYDQNACGSNDSIAPQMERETIHFMKQLFGLDEEYFGSYVTGATISNFVGLSIGRQWVGMQRGVDFANDGLSNSLVVKVISGTPHSSIIKSLAMNGMGRKALIKIDTLPDREAIDVGKLEKYLKNHQEPMIVIANAGTVNTVDFDDLEAIGKLKSKYNFWLHVDAAFGGFAGCSEKYGHYMKGINHADSVTIDAHKWLNVPYDSAMQFTRHKDIQLKVFQNSAAYLGDPEASPDFFHYTPENSRRFRALPSWFTLMAYGKEGYQEIVERNCACASALGEKIKQSDRFKLLAAVRMNVVCFTLNEENVTTEEIRNFLTAVRDDEQVFFTPTVYHGVPAIRAAISNWQTSMSDIEKAFEVLTKIYAERKASHVREVQGKK